jgi:hypothetical protein
MSSKDNDNDYKGMSKEAEEDYNKRQEEPLFKSARDLVPMEQLKEYSESLLCGYNKRTGCSLLVRDTSFYACMYHQAMQALGTDFMMYYKLMNDNELDRMSPFQHKALEQRRRYMMRWIENFPRGASE